MTSNWEPKQLSRWPVRTKAVCKWKSLCLCADRDSCALLFGHPRPRLPGGSPRCQGLCYQVLHQRGQLGPCRQQHSGIFYFFVCLQPHCGWLSDNKALAPSFPIPEKCMQGKTSLQREDDNVMCAGLLHPRWLQVSRLGARPAPQPSQQYPGGGWTPLRKLLHALMNHLCTQSVV